MLFFASLYPGCRGVPSHHSTAIGLIESVRHVNAAFVIHKPVFFRVDQLDFVESLANQITFRVPGTRQVLEAAKDYKKKSEIMGWGTTQIGCSLEIWAITVPHFMRNRRGSFGIPLDVDYILIRHRRKHISDSGNVCLMVQPSCVVSCEEGCSKCRANTYC